MGAPISTTYTLEEREAIIAHVLAELSGGRAVSRILREDEGMPERTTFWNWCISDDDLSNKVVRARENGVEAIMDETLEIADDKTQDTMRDESGAERPNTEWISRSRLRVETRHKYAQMIAPRKYGAKLDLTSGGEPIRPMDDTEKLTRLASIFAKAEAREPDSGAE